MGAIPPASHRNREVEPGAEAPADYSAGAFVAAGCEIVASADAVLAALHCLGAGPDTEHTPPTKQGGV